MKTYFTMAVTILTVLLLSSGGLLVTHAATPAGSGKSTTQTLTLTALGGVANAGIQNYVIGQNGAIEYAIVDGSVVVGDLTYSLSAQQNGMSTSGSANFHSLEKI